MVDHGRHFGAGPGGIPHQPGDPRQGYMAPGQAAPGQMAPGHAAPGHAPHQAASGDPRSLVRPYTVTGGRTRPRYDLAIEALVSAAPYPSRDITTLTPEYKAIIELCRAWRSVAEISALLRLPLGVARVLVADMAHEGLLRLHQARPSDEQPDLRLLERVLSGLRKL